MRSDRLTKRERTVVMALLATQILCIVLLATMPLFTHIPFVVEIMIRIMAVFPSFFTFFVILFTAAD